MTAPLDGLAEARYSQMLWNAPLSVEHSELLLRRLDVQPDSALLDLGCGWGELLVRAGGASAIGVDTDLSLLVRGRARAAAAGAEVVFIEAEAAAWSEPADRVICVGASHAWGDRQHAFESLALLVRPGGRLLFGDGFWERSPTAELAEMFDDVEDLAAVVGHAVAAGWRVLHLSTADQREWDDFESTWRAGRQQWLLDHGDDERSAEVRQTLDAQLSDYVTGYRGVLGFCYLVLGR